MEKVNAEKIWLLFTRDWENWGRILKRFRTYVPSLFEEDKRESGNQVFDVSRIWWKR